MPENKPGLKLVAWRPMVKNTLRGFASIEFPFGLRIQDITVHVKNGKAWIGMPGKAQLDQDGTVRRDDSGKVKYVQVLEWSNRERADQFRDKVLALVTELYPDALA